MVGIGRAEMVKGDWIKPGAVVIDCGINTITGMFHQPLSKQLDIRFSSKRFDKNNRPTTRWRC